MGVVPVRAGVGEGHCWRRLRKNERGIATGWNERLTVCVGRIRADWALCNKCCSVLEVVAVLVLFIHLHGVSEMRVLQKGSRKNGTHDAVPVDGG
jgi:hypothetical protein